MLNGCDLIVYFISPYDLTTAYQSIVSLVKQDKTVLLEPVKKAAARILNVKMQVYPKLVQQALGNNSVDSYVQILARKSISKLVAQTLLFDCYNERMERFCSETGGRCEPLKEVAEE